MRYIYSIYMDIQIHFKKNYAIFIYLYNMYTWIFQVCKICAFSLFTQKTYQVWQKFYISGRSRYIWVGFHHKKPNQPFGPFFRSECSWDPLTLDLKKKNESRRFEFPVQPKTEQLVGFSPSHPEFVLSST